jgi:molybdate transport system ATP-binding protein
MLKVDFEKNLLSPTGNFKLKLNFEIPKHHFFSLYGKSGSGKTTTLRIIAGLETPDSGFIAIDDEVWFDSSKNINLPPQKRDIGLVFQSYALFPNMSVYENITYGVKKRDGKWVKDIVDIMELSPLKERLPHTLSGGQQQRVALARAIVSMPKVLLLDEPLSALDISIRGVLQDEIKKIHDKFDLTTILVSHDIPEIIKLADKIIHIDNGHIERMGTPKEILFGKKLSSKFAFTGYVIDIIKADILYLAFISIGEDVVEVSMTEDDLKDIKIGDKVIVASKAYNPIIRKV